MADIDPITYQVLRHRLWSLNEEHGIAISRISGSPIVTFSHDFNPCLHRSDGELVFSGPYIQYLNAGASNAIAWINENYGADFIRPGDMFLTNDPWIGVSHQLDVCILALVHAGERLIAWVSNAVHQYDLGGPLPGSFTPHARSIYEETTPIPPIRIVEKGTIRPDLEQAFLRRSRLPDLLALDLRAGVGGCNVAKAALREAVDHFGTDTVVSAMAQIVDDAESAFINRLHAIPDGHWCQDYLIEGADDDLVRLTLHLTKRGDRLIFDNRDDPSQDVAQSMTEIGFKGAASAAVAIALCHDQLFAVGGAERHIDYELKPRSVGASEFPAASSCANMRVAHLVAIASHVVAKMLTCAGEASRDAVAAGGSAGMPVLLVSGRDANGREFGTALSDHMAGAVGPSPYRDGVDNGGHSWDPRSLVPNVEDQEYAFPILYLYRRELPGSGGAGERRGGNGGCFAYMPLGIPELVDATVTAGAATRTLPVPGLFGGNPSVPSRYLMIRDSGAKEDVARGRIPKDVSDLLGAQELLPAKVAGIVQHADDVFEERWTGSGGFGDPLDRPPTDVAEDVRAQRLTLEDARTLYGVAISDLLVDEEATGRLRRELRTRRAENANPAERLISNPGETTMLLDIAGRLRIVRNDVHQQFFACGSCGHVLAGIDDDFRSGCLTRELAPRELGTVLSSAHDDLDPRVVVHYAYCPGCLTALSAESTLAGLRPSRDLEVWL